MYRTKCIVSVIKASLFMIILLHSPEYAETSDPGPFHLTIKKETTLVLTGIALQLAGDHFISNVSVPDPAILRKKDVLSFDRFACNYYSTKLSKYSDNTKDATTVLFALTVLPFIKNVNSGRIKILISNVAMYLEAQSLMYGMTKCAKGLSERPRPFAYNSGLPAERRSHRTSFQSFWSGHASLAFTSAVFTGYVYQNRHPDSRFVKPVWILGLSCATATSILRVRSGTHFPTDVIVGSAAGSFIGWLIPRIHVEKKDAVSFSTEVHGSTGLGISYSF